MIEAMWKSFYSASLYRDVKSWRAKALFYLWLILVVCWTPVFLRFHYTSTVFFRRVQNEVLPKVPLIHFEKGRITTGENRPYILSMDDATKKTVAILDTSGRYTSLDGQEARLLVTDTKIFIRQNTGEIRVYDLSHSKTKPMTLDQPTLERILRIFKRWVMAALYIMLFVFSYLKRLVQAFFIAIAGLLLSSAVDTDLDLGELFSLAIVSMTPAMILETILTVSGKSYRFQWIAWFLLIVGYFVFAINAASDETAQFKEEI